MAIKPKEYIDAAQDDGKMPPIIFCWIIHTVVKRTGANKERTAEVLLKGATIGIGS
jgi:hypothetical protein